MSKFKNEVEFELPDEDKYPARCVYFYELGTQKSSNKKFPDKFKCRIGFELIGTKMTKGDRKGKPFVLFITVNKQLGSRSTLGKMLKKWKGLTFKKGDQFDPEDLALEPAIVDVEYNEDGDWANISKVLPAKGKIAKAKNEFQSLFLDDTFDEDVFDDLSENLQEKIEESPEYQELFGESKKKKKSKKRDDDDEDEDEDEPKSKKRSKSKKDDDEDDEDEDEDDDEDADDDDDEEDEDDDDEPKSKSRKRRRPDPDDDDEDDEDEDDADEDEDEDEDDDDEEESPKSRKKKAPAKKTAKKKGRK